MQSFQVYGCRIARFVRPGLIAVWMLLAVSAGQAQEAADEAAFSRQLPSEAKQHVYLFFLNGIDPLEFGDLSGLRDFCRELGFAKSWYGQFYHRWYFQRIIEEIRARDPQARLVIIGFSAGAIAARDLANALNRQNIPVDLLVYLDGATLTNSPKNRPDNVRRLIHIRANDFFFRGWAIEGAENVKCEDVSHFGTPMHAETRRRIAGALAEIAGRVPVALPPASVWPGDDMDAVPAANDNASPVNGPSLAVSQSCLPMDRDGPTARPASATGTPASLPRPSQGMPVAQVDGSRSVVAQKRSAEENTLPSQCTWVHSQNDPAWSFLRATRDLRPVPPPDYSGLPYQPLRP